MPFFSSSNKSTDGDIIGIACFFDFLCAVLSRIAYTEAPMPLFLLSGVFQIIPKEILVPLSKIKNIADLNKEEDLLFDLTNNTNNFPIRMYNGKKYINFISYVEKINNLIEDTKNSPYYNKKTDPNIKIISIADSNYGDILIIGIKYLPNFVFVSYRGTYSTKTAASYTRPDSLFPAKLDGQKKVLKGIAKITFELIHEVTAAMDHIAKTFLQAQLVIPVFTGHSLGGAMATIMDYEYISRISKVDSSTFNLLSKSAICISFGSPRVLGKDSSEELCKYIVNGTTLFHRYSNDGDPVTSMPPPGLGFYHPCSATNDKNAGYRKLVSRDCKSSTVMRPAPRSEYTKPINCKDVAPNLYTKIINVLPNIADHMTYLYVSFAKAADIAHLFIGSAFTIQTSEIGRVEKDDLTADIHRGDTEIRVIQMTGNNSAGIYSVYFGDLAKLRVVGVTGLAEDIKDTSKLFDSVNKTQVEVIFDIKTGLPTVFTKKTIDSNLSDFKPEYRTLLKEPGIPYVPVTAAITNGPPVIQNVGGKIKRNKTKKHKTKSHKVKSRKTRK